MTGNAGPRRRPTPQPRPTLELTAVDPATLSAAVSVTNALGEPRAAYNQPAGLAGYDPAWNARTVAEVAAEVLTRHQAELAHLGAAPPTGQPIGRGSWRDCRVWPPR